MEGAIAILGWNRKYDHSPDMLSLPRIDEMRGLWRALFRYKNRPQDISSELRGRPLKRLLLHGRV